MEFSLQGVPTGALIRVWAESLEESCEESQEGAWAGARVRVLGEPQEGAWAQVWFLTRF